MGSQSTLDCFLFQRKTPKKVSIPNENFNSNITAIIVNMKN